MWQTVAASMAVGRPNFLTALALYLLDVRPLGAGIQAHTFGRRFWRCLFWIALVGLGIAVDRASTLLLRVEICDLYATKFFLQVSKSLIVRLGQRVRDGVERICRITTRLPVDRTENAVFGNSLKGL
jgi:hypothetical protein